MERQRATPGQGPADAAGSAQTSGIRTDQLREPSEFKAAAELLWRVWAARSGRERTEVIGASVLTALAQSGNYVAGAYLGDRLLGCLVGWCGLADDDRTDSPRAAHHLHSHILGILPEWQGRGIGYRLKLDQGRWARKRGFTRIRWTFDPLAGRNAYFNLCKLGACVIGYKPQCYGNMDDGLNKGESTDRLLVEWSLESDRYNEALEGRLEKMVEEASRTPGAEFIGVPERAERHRIARWALRGQDGRRNNASREHIRARFEELLAKGYRVAGVIRDADHQNIRYVLLPPHSIADLPMN